MLPTDRAMPALLESLHTLDFAYEDEDGNGIEFEPYDAFYSQADTTHWIRAWTGNAALDGHEYLFFGQDGTGGMVGFWCIRDTEELLDQPIVFFGSEGALGVVACNIYDYLWLLAAGIGPMEAIEYGVDDEVEARVDFTHYAQALAAPAKKPAAAVLAAAAAEFPDFEKNMMALCR